MEDTKLQYIYSNYRIMSDKDIGTKLGYSAKYIEKVRLKQGWKRETPLNGLTEPEKEYIREHSNEKVKHIAEMLDRDPATVSKYLKEFLNCDRLSAALWTDEEISYIKSHYTEMNDADLAKALGRPSSDMVWKKRKELGLNRTKAINSARGAWSDEDNIYLISYCDILSVEKIAEHINRSVSSIRNRIVDLGLHKNGWTKSDDEFLAQNYRNYSFEKLAAELNRTVKAIKHRKTTLKLTRKPKLTSPEYIIQDLLTDLGADFEPQLRIAPYVVDFLVSGKYVIEVQGDYWHCNPAKYPDGPIDSIQAEHTKRDPVKKLYLESKGYVVLYIWESDINSSIDNVKTYLRAVLCSNM